MRNVAPGQTFVDQYEPTESIVIVIRQADLTQDEFYYDAEDPWLCFELSTGSLWIRDLSMSWYRRLV